MLTEEEIREIRNEALKAEQKQAACIGALKVVQKHRGWISDEAIADISGLLDMSPDELDGIATCYSLLFRRPVGRHVILICDSVSCWVMGYEKILTHLRKRLGIGPGETSADGKFTLLPVACLGICEHAPAIIIDTEVYGDLDDGRLDEILARY
ncbi:MAG TPA: NADH-quinone oxidoreductase subunit NuoE [Thermodesulfovibrionales bacterium]|nr:NADH-quinone oxidoreductase subunit NuoE [Thermodesulfovibrionales bacterium]